MTQRLDKVNKKKKDKVRGPSSNLAINGPKAQNENKYSSPDKIGRLHTLLTKISSSKFTYRLY